MDTNDQRSERRFAFGRNWQSFRQEHLADSERIELAKQSLEDLLGRPRLDGCRFLDIGSGSGLFSLAARELGATVLSFDFDPQSVASTTALMQDHRRDDEAWTITRGSVLDTRFMERLGGFDIVYAWGVLHHTGRMWNAIDNTLQRIDRGGTAYIALYNHQPILSGIHQAIKRAYNATPSALQPAIVAVYLFAEWTAALLCDLFRLRNPAWRFRRDQRGMAIWHDAVDWVGGYPFETASPEQMEAFCRKRGFELVETRRCRGGHGCNEYVIRPFPD